ncbi:MAG TPA: MFS transporter [Chloroflexota bacterium]|nr:MFS transporter [Chloroflexota bacterium]
MATIVLAAGSRTSLAALLRPIEADLGLDRAVLSTAGALTVLTYGLGQPLVGALAARFGARRVMVCSAVLMGFGGFGVATASQPWQLYLWAGIIPGLAFAGASTVPATALLAGWFAAQLGLATGIMSSAIPAGQSLFVPVGTALVPAWGWRVTYLALALAVPLVAVPLLGLLVREAPRTNATDRAKSTSARPGLDIWLLGVGYFGCGFSDQFVSLHLVALAADGGIPALLSAGLLSLLLVVGIVGSIGSGPFADRVSPRSMLTVLYFTRAASMPLLFLAAPDAGIWPLVLFGVLFGTTYIANQAPGARLVRDRYGVQAVGPLMGGVGLAHQVGGALGVGLGGLSVAQTGNYGLAIVGVTIVVLVGGLAQLLIPARSAQ